MGTILNKRGYQGDFSENEEETSLDEFDLRHYDPQIGRWTTSDPYEQFASPYLGMGNSPINNVDPDGGSIFNFWESDLLNHFADAAIGSAVGTAIGAISGGVNGAKQGAMWGAGAGLLGGFVDWNAVGGALGDAGSWIGNQFSGISPYWILYNGLNVNIYKGKFDNASNLYMSLAGTSGGNIVYQNSFYQGDEYSNLGPVPEGEYKINLTLNPRRFIDLAPNGESNQNLGIQRVITKDGRSNLAWGRWRARLEKVNVNSTRDNFYFHDSYKGFSHGCVETETPLYYLLLSQHDLGSKSLKVRISYPSSNSSTYGKTDKLDVKIPKNVQKYLKSQGFPAGTPTKSYPYIPIPDYPYNFEK